MLSSTAANTGGSRSSVADTTSPPTVRALPNSSRAVSVNVVFFPATAVRSAPFASSTVEFFATGPPAAKETFSYGESPAAAPSSLISSL